MYIFEAHYTNMDNNEEITRKIEFDGQFMENERKICLCDRLQSDRGNPVASSHCHGWRHGHGCG